MAGLPPRSAEGRRAQGSAGGAPGAPVVTCGAGSTSAVYERLSGTQQRRGQRAMLPCELAPEALGLYRLQTTGTDQEEQRQAVQAVQAAQGPASSAGPTCWRPRCSPSGGAVVLRLSSLHPQLHPQGQLQGRATDMFDLLKR